MDIPNFKSVVVLGASGITGRYVRNHFAQSYPVTSLTRDNFDFDTSAEKALNFLRTIIRSCQLIINCIEISCGTELLFYRINTVLPRLIAVVCKERGSLFAHITTDRVFDGQTLNSEKPIYDFLAKHTSTDIYGLSKSLGDAGCVGYYQTAVFRTSVIGESVTPLAGFSALIERVIEAKDQIVFGCTNHHWNGMTALQLAKEIEKRAKYVNISGTWPGEHILATDHNVSEYDAACLIAETYGVNTTVLPAKADNPVWRVLRPSPKGWTTVTLKDQLQEMYELDILNRRTKETVIVL